MSVSIRPVELEDLQQIINLWQPPQKEERLLWLWTDPEDPGKLNAFVAVDEMGHIKGVIAYNKSTYTYGKKTFTCLFPHSWKIEAGYKGFTGIALMKKALSQSSVSIAVGGTYFSTKLYPLFKFGKALERYKFYTVFKPLCFYRSLSGPAWRRLIKTFSLLPSYFMTKLWHFRSDSIQLVPYDGGILTHTSESTPRIEKNITKSYIDWIMRCPDMETHVFHIFENDRKIGFCILLISTSSKSRIGRIDHLSFLGENLTCWSQTLHLILKFFKRHGCCAVSTVASDQTAIKAHAGIMQKFLIAEPVLIRDPQRTIHTSDLSRWHIQFSEGDTAFLTE
jgi:hypothetical protein